MTRRQFLMGVGPSVFVMAALLLFPLGTTLVWSFQKVSYGTPGVWVGLSNYGRLLEDRIFRNAVGFSVAFALVDTALLMVLGYGLALLMNRVHRGRPIFLGLLLVPYVVPAIISATAFGWLFDDNFGGLVNYFLSYVGVHNIHWFTGTWPNRGMVLMEALWGGLPFYMLVFLGALQGVSAEQVEAAEIDGANWFQRQWHVVIPSIGPMFRFLVLISVSSTLGIFDALVVLSPNAQVVGNQSVNQYIYRVAFNSDQQQLGVGSAVSVLMLIVMFTLVSPIVRRIYGEVKAP